MGFKYVASVSFLKFTQSLEVQVASTFETSRHHPQALCAKTSWAGVLMPLSQWSTPCLIQKACGSRASQKDTLDRLAQPVSSSTLGPRTPSIYTLLGQWQTTPQMLQSVRFHIQRPHFLHPGSSRWTDSHSHLFPLHHRASRMTDAASLTTSSNNSIATITTRVDMAWMMTSRLITFRNSELLAAKTPDPKRNPVSEMSGWKSSSHQVHSTQKPCPRVNLLYFRF